MAVTPEQDVLSLVAKATGTWRLTRVRGWLDEKPIEQTIDIPGIARHPPKSDARLFFLDIKLIVTSDGTFAVAIASGTWRSSAGISTHDDVVSVVDLHEFRVVKTAHGPPLAQEPVHGGDGANRHREYALDRAGHLVVRTNTSLRSLVSYCDSATGRTVRTSTTAFDWERKEVELQFLSLPNLTVAGEGHYRENLTCAGWIRDDPGEECAATVSRIEGSSIPLGDFLKMFSNIEELRLKDPLKHRCPISGVTRDGRFEMETCFEFGLHTFWGGPGKPRENRENILSVKTGLQVGTLDELAINDSAGEQFADHKGRDYLLVLEGGTRLKVYAITE